MSRKLQFCSRQFQFYSRQFQFVHGISIYSRQFQFAHGNFNFLTATLTVFFASLTTCPTCQLWWPTVATKSQTQNQKSIFKVDLQSEKWKSKIESRFKNAYASRQWVTVWVDNRRVYWSRKIASFIWHSPGGLLDPVNMHSSGRKNVLRKLLCIPYRASRRAFLCVDCVWVR